MRGDTLIVFEIFNVKLYPRLLEHSVKYKYLFNDCAIYKDFYNN